MLNYKMDNLTERPSFNNFNTQIVGNISFQDKDLNVSLKAPKDYLLVAVGVPICLENLLALVVLCRSHRLIYQVPIVFIVRFVTYIVSHMLHVCYP